MLAARAKGKGKGKGTVTFFDRDGGGCFSTCFLTKNFNSLAGSAKPESPKPPKKEARTWDDSKVSKAGAEALDFSDAKHRIEGNQSF